MGTKDDHDKIEGSIGDTEIEGGLFVARGLRLRDLRPLSTSTTTRDLLIFVSGEYLWDRSLIWIREVGWWGRWWGWVR